MPFKELKFCYNWRTYQEKFLSQFESHIHDNHLHVIAPPGSGKTILGLEISQIVFNHNSIWFAVFCGFFNNILLIVNFGFRIKKRI